MNACNQKQVLRFTVPRHPLYILRQNYDDKWDTIEYRSIYDLYICSVVAEGREFLFWQNIFPIWDYVLLNFAQSYTYQVL